MAPLILHNVPDDELYVGDDGVKRPYAMVFPQLVRPEYAKLCTCHEIRRLTSWV